MEGARTSLRLHRGVGVALFLTVGWAEFAFTEDLIQHSLAFCHSIPYFSQLLLYFNLTFRSIALTNFISNSV